MADKKISQLVGASTPLAGTEVLPIVQSGSTVKVSVANLTAGRTVDAATVNATTVDATNVEVTNVKAKDGTAALTIADSTGVVTVAANPILNGGTANGVVYLNASKAATTGSVLVFDGTNFGVGTNTPGARLHVNVTDTANAGVAAAIIRQNGSGNNGVVIDVAATPSNYVADYRIANSSVMRITADGELFVAGLTDQGAYNIQCNGTGVWGAGAYFNGSDERLKNNIQPIDSALDAVNAMRPVTFQYKPEHSKDQSVQPGFIAQELQTALAGKPYLNGVVQAGREHLNVAYQNIIPLLTKAIQEQQVIIEQLKADVAALKGA